MIKARLQILGFTSKSIEKELLQQTIGQIGNFECRQWSLELPNKQSVHNNQQNMQSLVNADDIQNNLSISNFDFSFVPQDNLVQPNQNQDQLENINLQNEQPLNSNTNDEFDFFQPENYGFENHNDDDPFADLTTNWNNSFSNFSLFDPNF